MILGAEVKFTLFNFVIMLKKECASYASRYIGNDYATVLLHKQHGEVSIGIVGGICSTRWFPTLVRNGKLGRKLRL